MAEEEIQGVVNGNDGEGGPTKLADELTWNRFYARVREIDHAARLESNLLLGFTILLVFALYSANSDDASLISVGLPWLGVVASLTCYWRGYLGEQNRRVLAARWQATYADKSISPLGREEGDFGPPTLSSYGLVALATAVFWLVSSGLTMLTFLDVNAHDLRMMTGLAYMAVVCLPFVSVFVLFMALSIFQSRG